MVKFSRVLRVANYVGGARSHRRGSIVGIEPGSLRSACSFISIGDRVSRWDWFGPHVDGCQNRVEFEQART